MELREMIETAAKIAGDQNSLAKVIGVDRNNLTAAKAGRRGLPEVACGKLAEILEVDRWTVIAASALITERDPEKRAYLAPFVLELPRKAAAWLIAIASGATIGTVAPNDAHASDTLNVSTPTLKAAPSLKQQDMYLALCQVAATWFKRIIASVPGMFAADRPRFGFAGS